MDALNLWVPPRISRATGKSATPLSIERVLLGLHQGRTVVITGASAGIGAQLARFLAIAGARVLLAARDERKLEQTRDAISRSWVPSGTPSRSGAWPWRRASTSATRPGCRTWSIAPSRSSAASTS